MNEHDAPAHGLGMASALLALALIAALQIGSSRAADRTLPSEARIGSKFVFDLTTGAVNGYAIIGKTYPSVAKALGKPSQRSIRKDYGTASYGDLRKGAWPLWISFARRRGALRAWSVAIATPFASEVRLGRILGASPKVIQSKISGRYVDEVRLAKPYRCRRRPLRCRGEFKSTTGDLNVGFGLVRPRAGSARYIVIYET